MCMCNAFDGQRDGISFSEYCQLNFTLILKKCPCQKHEKSQTIYLQCYCFEIL